MLQKRLLLVSFILFSNLIFAQHQGVVEGISLERLKHYETFIEAQVENHDIPGAATVVYRNGKKVYEKAIGYSDVSTQTPISLNGRFYIQSMTKPIITAAFMMLYEEGHFLLTDPVSKYLPAFKDMKVATDVSKGLKSELEDLKTPITISHLLSHTAGLSHGLGGSELDKQYAMTMYYKQHKDIQNRVNAMAKLPLIGQPGEQWYYSAAPDVVSVLIEQFSGMSTAEFLAERIFKPLGMEDTGYNIPEADQEKMVYVHNKNKKGELEKSARQPAMSGNTIWSGVNALYSTPKDYATFAQMLLNKGEFNGQRFLSPKTIDLMTANHTGDLYNGDGEYFGLGFSVVNHVGESHLLGSEGTFYWSGANNTHFFIDPKEQIVAVFMTQLAPFSNFYHRKLRQLVLQAVVD